MKDFFISYNQADKAWAEWIAWVLESKGFTSHIQAWDFLPGSNWVLEMQKGAVETRHTLAVLSPEFLTADYTQPEWAAAFARDPQGDKHTLIPVMVRKCQPEGLLKPIVHINLVGLTEAAAQEALLAGVAERRLKPTARPAFPGKTTKPIFPPELLHSQIWNVPLPRNPNFTGRVELLENLRRSLESGAQVALTALHGLGGVGKTQTALEYAYRHRQDYTVIWWVRAEEPARLASDYAALAGELDPAYREVTDQRILKEFVRRWLENNSGWLLVLDNVGKPEDLTDFRPSAASGHLLITSRHEDWRAYGKPLSVPTFDRQSESVVFLLQRTGQTDAPAAAELAQDLGDLPLALEHAAAYCCEVGCSLKDYRKLFLQRRTELLVKAKTPPGYDATILTTWNVSFTEVAQTPGAAELLSLCAFLAPDDIPLEMIKAGVKHLPEELAKILKDDLKLNQALAALKGFSLITRTDDALSLHRLVQTVLRDRMTEAERKTWAAAAVEIVSDAFPQESYDVRTWSVCARLLPHAVIAAEHAGGLDVAQEAAARLWNQSGIYLKCLADFKTRRHISNGRCALMRKPLVLTIPTSPFASTTWARCFGLWAT